MTERLTFFYENMPTIGGASVPYLSARTLAYMLMAGVEIDMQEVTGAGGVGGSVDVPFDPAIVLSDEPAAPVFQLTMLGATVPDISMLTGAVAASAVTITPKAGAVSANVSLPVTVLANAAVAVVISIGFRGIAPSL